ncbi:MAG: DUF1971 domain-containing protein [Alphaproteobacteria bacterium]|nr:DUF1971 domain-containing protein [Alphaproteobacteria bacterium]HPF48054.1 DUF1971 domain-containing protein [Emcibacteraceae bacterium]HRW30239.1 DUF1971 domain-containing protein [Emcibacteraceae bacterium]
MSKTPKLPDIVKPYFKTSLFNYRSVPEKLLSDHNLKKGTWGLLCVEKGEVRYFLAEQKKPLSLLTEGDCQVIESQVLHYIRPSKDAEFYIEFYK